MELGGPRSEQCPEEIAPFGGDAKTKCKITKRCRDFQFYPIEGDANVDGGGVAVDVSGGGGVIKARTGENPASENSAIIANWRRIILLIIAITVHNIPEG